MSDFPTQMRFFVIFWLPGKAVPDNFIITQYILFAILHALVKVYLAQFANSRKSVQEQPNVQAFEEYRKMQVEFKKSIQVQNESVDQSTAASAMAAGYMRQGSRFIKQAHGTASFGAVDAYSYFDADHHLDQALRESGFADKSGEDLVRFLEHASDVETETYFYVQKLALQAAFEKILGRGGDKGSFARWVGEGPDGQGGQLATMAAGKSFSSNMFERGLAIDMLSAGSGELGSHGARPGGAPAGFYVQLKWMDGWVQQEQARGMTAAIGTTNPVETLINQFNPIMMIGNANYNVQMKSTFEGYDKNQLILGEIGNMFHGALSTGVAIGTSVLTNSLMALGGAFGGGAPGAAAGAAIGVGIALVANTIVDGFEIDERGRGSWSMDQQKLAGVIGKSLATMLPGGVIGAVAGQAAISAAQAGFTYDEKGNQVGGWKMDARKMDQLALEASVGAITHIAGGGLDGKSGGLAAAIGASGFAGRAVNSAASSAIGVAAAYAEMQVTGGATAIAKYNAMNDVGMNRLGSLMASGYEWQTGAISGAANQFAKDYNKDNVYEWLVAGKSLGEKQTEAMKTAGYSDLEIALAKQAQENNNRHQAAQILLGAAYVNSRRVGFTADGEPYHYDSENGYYVTASGNMVYPDGTPVYYVGPAAPPPKMAPPANSGVSFIEKGINFISGNGFASNAEIREGMRLEILKIATAELLKVYLPATGGTKKAEEWIKKQSPLIQEDLRKALAGMKKDFATEIGRAKLNEQYDAIRIKEYVEKHGPGPHYLEEAINPMQKKITIIKDGKYIEYLAYNDSHNSDKDWHFQIRSGPERQDLAPYVMTQPDGTKVSTPFSGYYRINDGVHPPNDGICTEPAHQKPHGHRAIDAVGRTIADHHKQYIHYDLYVPEGGKVIAWDPSINAVTLLTNDAQREIKIMHLSGLNRDIYVGQSVTAGQYLGRVGGAGGYPPHLHMEVFNRPSKAYLSTDKIMDRYFGRDTYKIHTYSPTPSPYAVNPNQ